MSEVADVIIMEHPVEKKRKSMQLPERMAEDTDRLKR